MSTNKSLLLRGIGGSAKCGSAPSPNGGRLKIAVCFTAHQIFATLGVIFAAPWVLVLLGEIGLHVGLQGSSLPLQWLLYGTPFFPGYVLLAIALGWLLSGWLRHRSMLWVWALPLLALCVGVVRYPQIPRPSYITMIAVLGVYPWQRFVPVPPGRLGLVAALSHFLGWGHGVQPYDQVLVVVPFYTAAAYSIGAVLARRFFRADPFFKSLRQLRVWRLALALGLPWFLIRGIQLWEHAAFSLPFYRTIFGIQIILGGLLAQSALATLVFGVTIALVGPRFGVTRFFLSGKEQRRPQNRRSDW